ncbi:MAG: TolC family protein, partial [Steroidobacteraceae bacterium]
MTSSVRLLVASGLSLLACSSQAADLLTVYERALQNDPQIREADANRLASRESKPQAVAALLPQLNASGGVSRVDQEATRTTLINSDPSVPTSPLVPRTIGSDSDLDFTQYELTLRQTLFRWDQWAALRRADAQVAQAEADYQAAQQDLILRASQRYFDVLAAQDTVDAAQATLEAFSRQLEQADKRFEVGLI